MSVEPNKDTKAACELAIEELGELHRYARGLFDFESKWSGAIWTANAVACGWLVAANPNYLEEFSICLVFMFVNGIAIYAMSRAVPRFRVFKERLNELANLAGDQTRALRPDLPLNQLVDVLVTMQKVSVALFIVWGLTGFYKLLLHCEILGKAWAI